MGVVGGVRGQGGPGGVYRLSNKCQAVFLAKCPRYILKHFVSPRFLKLDSELQGISNVSLVDEF